MHWRGDTLCNDIASCCNPLRKVELSSSSCKDSRNNKKIDTTHVISRGGEWSSEKNEKSRQILPKSQNLAQPTNGLGVSDFVSVGHIFAFLSSHYTFSSRARILKCQSRRLGESRI